MSSSEHIGRRIARKRKQSGLTQEKLAKLTEVSRSLIGQIELGNVNPTLEFLKKFIRICDTNYYFLIEGREIDEEEYHYLGTNELMIKLMEPSLTDEASLYLQRFAREEIRKDEAIPDMISLIHKLIDENTRHKHRIVELFEAYRLYSDFKEKRDAQMVS